MLALLKSRFEQEGFEVVSTTTGEGSSEQVSRHSVDLIVVGKQPTETYGSLTNLGARSVPVILLMGGELTSGELTGGELAGGEAAGEFGEVVLDVAQLKLPFRPSQLVELARKAIASA